VERHIPEKGIAPLAKAIRKARLNESQLTSIHPNLLQLCLIAKNVKPALEFLDIDITDISMEVSNTLEVSKFEIVYFSRTLLYFFQNGNYDAKHFLLYYYYGGLIYATLKNYERSLYAFEVALTTPASAISHIMLESYKKYILVSLILHGKVIQTALQELHLI